MVVMRDVAERKRTEEHVGGLNAKLQLPPRPAGSLAANRPRHQCLSRSAPHTLATLVDLITPQLGVDAVTCY